MTILAGQVELRTFAARQRIYKIGDPSEDAYIMISGCVRITTVDEDHQEVLLDEPELGDFFGFASMLDQTAHRTEALAMEETQCIEVNRHDIPRCSSANPWRITMWIAARSPRSRPSRAS